MRPGQNNKRMRFRPNNRKGPNPLTRSYESSGPDVKIRGTAHHIGEKYLQLARDAQTSGDPIMAECYLQHAEHYFRLIAAAQQAQQQGLGAYQGQPGEAIMEEAEDDSDFGAIPDRFASPVERLSPLLQPSLLPQPQPGPAQPGPERPFHGNGDSLDFTRPERAPRPERPFQDRNSRDRKYQAYPEKPYQEQRPYQERNGRGRDQESRGNRGRSPRDFRNEGSIRVDPRAEPQIAEAVEGNVLPAFITAPVRVPAETHDAAPPVEALSPLLVGPADVDDAASAFHQRSSRRRGGKAETAVAEPHGGEEANANDSVQD
ncbi:MAG: DUF4167 domain-containing protein [Methylocella sp.]